MEDFNALFNPNVDVKDTSSKNLDEYSPTADKGSGNVYQAIIRFIPWWKDPTHGSIQEKWTSWLVDPITQKGRFVDCPSSVGKPSVLQDMFWKLKKNDSVALQKKASIFSRRHSFSSVIQVIKDKHNPDLDGKLLIYRYGIKIWEKINAELKPLIGDKHDPFDIINGKPFALVITKVSGFNNYDQSKFIDQKIPLCIPNNEGKLIPISEDSNKQEVFNWVKENSPDLSKYGYREWDKETNDYVNNVIAAVTGKATTSQNYADVRDQDGKPGNEGITTSDLNLDDLDEQLNGNTDLPDLEIPDLNNDNGISGDLDDVLKNL